MAHFLEEYFSNSSLDSLMKSIKWINFFHVIEWNQTKKQWSALHIVMESVVSEDFVLAIHTCQGSKWKMHFLVTVKVKKT